MTTKQQIRMRRKWKKWMKEIQQDLATLLTSNSVFHEVRHIFATNKQIQVPTLFYRWISNNYADSVVIGVRRLADKHTKVISLYRLIEDISKNREAITRSYYVSRYCKEDREEGLADDDFDEFARIGEELISQRKLSIDLKKVKTIADHIRKFTNKWVAHCDPHRRRHRIPTYKDLSDALHDLDRLFCKYDLLVRQGGLTTCKPEIQYDWKKPLRYVWLPKNFENMIKQKVEKALEGMHNVT